MKSKGLGGEMIAELFGTFILILLGDGVVANVGLAPRLAPGGYDWVTIALGWGFAVVIAVYVVGGVTGAHINPAVTIAVAVKRDFPWGKVLPYIVAQLIGAFLGAAAVYLIYHDGLVAAADSTWGIPNVWCTGPGSVFGQAFWGGGSAEALGVYGMVSAGFAEFFGTMVLLWGVLAMFDERNVGLSGNWGFFMVGMTVLAIGLSLGGPSGYAINPARDLGPRIFGALIGGKHLFDGLYWLIVPVIIPAIAGAIGVFVYDWLVVPFLPAKEA
jgi:glycerol uptake facilitator protein